MGKKIRIGLIGCGRVAENHIISIHLCGSAEITAVGGGRHSKEMGERLNVPVLEPDELCESALVDAVCVLTPPRTHYAYAMRAIQAGKHVLVEKPVSFSVEEIINMRRAAAEKGVICMPGHSYIYLPEIKRMKDVVGQRRLGVPGYFYMSEVYSMAADLAVKYDGPEIDVLCHELYLSLAFLGKPHKISAFRTIPGKAASETSSAQVAVMMEYDSGTLAQILVSWYADDYSSDPWTFKMKLLGNEGCMHFSRRDFVEIKGAECECSLYQEMFNCEMKWFVEECIGKGIAPLSTMEDAEWVCRLHHLVMEAIRNGKVVEVSK